MYDRISSEVVDVVVERVMGIEEEWWAWLDKVGEEQVVGTVGERVISMKEK